MSFVTVMLFAHIVLKASRTLNFIKQNLHMCPKEVKETAYLTLVRPCLEYVSSVWDPYQYNHI